MDENAFWTYFWLIEHVWQSEKCAGYYSNLAKFWGGTLHRPIACLRVQNYEEARASVPNRHRRLCLQRVEICCASVRSLVEVYWARLCATCIQQYCHSLTAFTSRHCTKSRVCFVKLEFNDADNLLGMT